MTVLDSLGEVFVADALIVGGGPAGLIAGIRIKERDAGTDVLIVDKATVGKSGGKGNKGAGVLFMMSEDDDIDEFREFHMREIGHYLNDQEMLELFAKTSLEVAEQLEEWGIPICRDADGKLAKIPDLPLWSLCGFDLDWMEKLRKRAMRLGVRMLDKTQVIDLLTNDRKVTGAVGFDITDGSFRIFKAKATLLATGGCNYMVTNMWSAARGDGIAAAFRAGAEMRNAEYGNFYNLHLRGNMAAIVGGQYALYNEAGENLAERYCGEYECDINIGIILGMEKDVMDGKGPIRFEPSEFSVKNPIAHKDFLQIWDRPAAKVFWDTLMGKERRYMPDTAPRPEVIPGYIGELTCVRVDHNMRTSLEGLWALGDTSHAGSAWAGATACPPGRIRGAALAYTNVSALLSTASALEYLGQADTADVDFEQVRLLKERIYRPLEQRDGLSPRILIDRLKDVIAPPRYSARKSAERLLEGLERIEAIRADIPHLSMEGDWHLLGLYHDLSNMLLCAEIFFVASLERTESRGWHVREDYPERDDKDWLKWVIVEQVDGRPHATTEDIPIERYKSQPF
jgi:succinate dehydrogenase/fumarate reductase flavoprotein subunit